jgi:hypothetical protein
MFTDTKVFSAYAVDDLVQDERGITQGDGPFIAAWFKDPAGNILEVLQERPAGRTGRAGPRRPHRVRGH